MTFSHRSQLYAKEISFTIDKLCQNHAKGRYITTNIVLIFLTINYVLFHVCKLLNIGTKDVKRISLCLCLFELYTFGFLEVLYG